MEDRSNRLEELLEPLEDQARHGRPPEPVALRALATWLLQPPPGGWPPGTQGQDLWVLEGRACVLAEEGYAELAASLRELLQQVVQEWPDLDPFGALSLFHLGEHAASHGEEALAETLFARVLAALDPGSGEAEAEEGGENPGSIPVIPFAPLPEEVGARCALGLVEACFQRGGAPEELARLLERAAAWLERVPTLRVGALRGPDLPLGIRLNSFRARLEATRGRTERARDLLDKCLRDLDEAPGPEAMAGETPVGEMGVPGGLPTEWVERARRLLREGLEASLATLG